MDSGEIKVSSRDAVELLERIMGSYHAYYARAALDRLPTSIGLVYYIHNMPAGTAVCYTAVGSMKLGVIYYVAVDHKFRGRGIGKALVSSCERALDMPETYVATIELRNHPSARMFQQLGYTVKAYSELAREVGWKAISAIHHATCSYEEDLIALKPASPKAVEKLPSMTPDDYKEVWWEICYKPWMERKYRALV